MDGNVKQAHIALALRLVDARTSRLVAATSVEGKAVNVSVATHGGEKKFAGKIDFKTPIEKAIRLALDEAVKFIVDQTPARYYRHPSDDSTTTASAPASIPKVPRVKGGR